MSSSDFNGGFLTAILWLGTIAVSIFSGYMAWNWIEPESFGGALIFLAAWSLISYIGHIIVGGIIALIGSKMD
jgi:hypothetical protein